MNRERLDRLTDKQRACLRLVYAHKETKEIARILGLSPDGINQRIKTAMNALGVSRRREAAQLLAEAEGLGTYPPLVHPSWDIAPSPEPAKMGSSAEGERYLEGATSDRAVHEYQAAFIATPPRPQGPRVPLPYWGVRPSDLGKWHRLGWIFGLMLMIAFMFGVFLAGLEALSRLGRMIAS